jgi:hypothetical protein
MRPQKEEEMNSGWKCPKCGAINSNQSTSACCVNCGNSRWFTKSITTEPLTGTCFETPQPICPDCARLRALLGDAAVLLDMYADVHGKGKLQLKFDKALKKEGIV